MWEFANPIRQQIPETRWPSAGEAASSIFFQPITVGQLQLSSRTWVPAMVPWRATEEGFVTEANLDWYRRFAQGKPGALVVEATGVRDVPSGPLLRIGHDRFVPGLRQLVEVVRRASGGRTKLFIQTIDFLAIRRRPEREVYLRRYLRPRDEHRERLAGVIDDERPTATGESTPPEAAGRRPGRSFAEATDDEVRAALSTLDDAALERVLDPRELEDLRFGYRERVTDLHLPQVRELPEVLPGIF